MENKLKEIIEKKYIDDRDGDRYGFEVYCDYDEYLSDESLAEITRSESPQEKFDEIMDEWLERAVEYYYPELLKEIKNEIGDDEYYENEDKIKEWVDANVYWFMPKKHFNTDVDVVVSLDTGDLNYDFTKCNILNWYGTCDGGIGELEDESPIKWLAIQQGRLEELKAALGEEGLDQGTDFQTENGHSKFVKTVIQELQNATSHMNTLIFLVKMPLFDFIKLRELIESEKKDNSSYYFDERKGKKEFIVTKDSMCGLYDVWSGGGSVLEIVLEKDVVIPTKAIFDVWIDCRGSRANARGYDVSDVYSLDSSAFTGSVHFVED